MTEKTPGQPLVDSEAPRVVGLRLDPLGGLVLSLSTGELCGVVPVRCFPLSAPAERISFCDERGIELYCLTNLDALSPSDRALLEQELARREFIPVIRRILSVSPGAEPTYWHVDTDLGETRFTLTSEDQIRTLGRFSALIADSNGVRYRVLDKRKLDKRSRKLLNQYF